MHVWGQACVAVAVYEIIGSPHLDELAGAFLRTIFTISLVYIYKTEKHLKMNKEVRMLLPKKDLLQVE